jgi:cytochrome b6-f complex iron-sulfur subunit
VAVRLAGETVNHERTTAAGGPPSKSGNGAAPAVGRRIFLSRVWTWLGVAAAAEFAAVLGAYLWPRKRSPEDAKDGLVEAGPVADFTPSSVTAFPQGRFYLARLADGGFLALSSTCSHLGCTVPWNPRSKTFPCPCHASVFDITGAVKGPPAPRPLDVLAVTIKGGIVEVDTRRRIRRQKFEPSQVTYL